MCISEAFRSFDVRRNNVKSLGDFPSRRRAFHRHAPGRPKLFTPRAHQHSFHSRTRHAFTCFNFEKNLLVPVSAEVALVVGSSPSRAIARRAEVAPRYERAHARRHSPRVAPFAAPRTRPGDERVAASADARRNPVRRGSTRGTATHRGSSAARPGRHPRTPGLDAGRPRAIGPHARDVTDRFPSATVSSLSSPPRPNLLIITSPRRRKRKPDPRCARSPRCSFPSPCTPRFRCACSRPCARSPASPAGAPPRASGCSG